MSPCYPTWRASTGSERLRIPRKSRSNGPLSTPGSSRVRESPNSAIDAKGRAYRRLTTTSNDLRAALVDEPMAQLHECAMPIGKFFGSA